MTKARWVALGAVGLIAYAATAYAWKRGFLPTQAVDWQRAVEPGRLSAAHAFLERDCAACHTSVGGADSDKCISCHSGNDFLVSRQPTSFHATIGNCRDCHPEHLGSTVRPTAMDHAALVRAGLRLLHTGDPGSESLERYRALSEWIKRAEYDWDGAKGLSPGETTLNCVTCHSSKDRHLTLFGDDCVRCHSTQKWSIPEFKHPSAKSTDCAQCHQAPPSHYMMHFHMVSMRVAGQHHARVDQCYLCHQTTAWNDIKGVGWYKHH